jgi:hypothetical protein
VNELEYQSKVEAATALSLFGHFPVAEWSRLFSTARRVAVPAGATLFLGASPQPALVIEGVIKVYMTAPDGRQLTIHYLKPASSRWSGGRRRCACRPSRRRPCSSSMLPLLFGSVAGTRLLGVVSERAFRRLTLATVIAAGVICLLTGLGVL